MALLQHDSWPNERLFRLKVAAKPSQGLASPTFKTRSQGLDTVREGIIMRRGFS